jgi:phosphoribosylamine-glycine ligase
MKIEWNEKPCLTVVAAAKGYPGEYNTLTEIKNIESLKLMNMNSFFMQELFRKIIKYFPMEEEF